MQYRLRTLMLFVLAFCILLTFYPPIKTWWWSQTRPAVTFAGSTFDDRVMAFVAGVRPFAELTQQQTEDATNEIVRAYRTMGHFNVRVGIKRIDSKRGLATQFIIDEGQRYNANQPSGITLPKSVLSKDCAHHGLYLSWDEDSTLTAPRQCPICDITK